MAKPLKHTCGTEMIQIQPGRHRCPKCKTVIKIGVKGCGYIERQMQNPKKL